MRSRVLSLMEDDKNKYTRLLMNLMKVWQDAPHEGETESEGELFVGGLSEMFNIPDFKDYDKMRELFAAFEEKHRLLKLLDMAIDADGVQVFIGSENKCFEMQGVSLVISSYRSEGNIVGTLGVIGPSRMPYNTVIPLVDCTARVLGRLLSER
jgi:heat-inducible transcriptional repressor